MVLIILIMTMQKKTIYKSTFSPPNHRFTVSPKAAIMEHWTCRFLRILQNSRKRPNSWKISNFWTRGDSNSWKREKQKKVIPVRLPTPIYKMRMISVLWNISFGHLGLSVCLCSLPPPAHLLISWMWETDKSPWFHSNNWKTSVLSTLFLY